MLTFVCMLRCWTWDAVPNWLLYSSVLHVRRYADTATFSQFRTGRKRPLPSLAVGVSAGDVTSPAYVRPPSQRTLLPCTEKDGHPKPRQPPFPHTSYIGNRNTEKTLFVNSVNRITIQKSLDIINRNIHDPLSGSLRSPGDMRSDDAVFSLEKRIIPP